MNCLSLRRTVLPVFLALYDLTSKWTLKAQPKFLAKFTPKVQSMPLNKYLLHREIQQKQVLNTTTLEA